MSVNGETTILCHEIRESWHPDVTDGNLAYSWRRKCVDPPSVSTVRGDGQEDDDEGNSRNRDDFKPCEEDNGYGPNHLTQLPLQSRNEARNLFSTLSREQLVDLLSRACVAHQDVQYTVGKMIEESPSSRRLMIRNIPFTTQNADLLRLLTTKFGHVEDFTIVREKDTQKSKGFGFVTFTNIESVKKALNSNIVLDKRNLIIKLANDQSDICYATMLANQAAPQHPQMTNSYGQRTSTKNMSEPIARSLSHSKGHGGQESPELISPWLNAPKNKQAMNFTGKRKVFVGGLTPTTSSSRLRSSMSVFGCIEECVVINKQKPEGHLKVSETNNPNNRTFGYVTFSRMSDSLKAVQSKDRIVDGANVFISFANDQPKPSGSRASPPGQRANLLNLADHHQPRLDHSLDIDDSRDPPSHMLGTPHHTPWLGSQRNCLSHTDGHLGGLDYPSVPLNLPTPLTFGSSSFAATTSASFLDYPFSQSPDGHPINEEGLPPVFLGSHFSDSKCSLHSSRFPLPPEFSRTDRHSLYNSHFYT